MPTGSAENVTPRALVEGMTRPGPKPTPTHLRVLRGDRKDRINVAEPKPKKQKPRCPDWLNPEAKVVWKRVAKQLDAMGLLFSADADIIVAYSHAVVNYQKATRLVEEHGLLVEGRRDGMVTNPAVRIQRDSAQLIRQFASELGLTPSSRSRLSVEEAAADAGDDILD
jgi:P27 family predicted phage terminase small subunit